LRSNESGKYVRKMNRVLVSAMVMLILTGFVFSQDAVTAQSGDLQVPPPSYAKFDAELTQTMLGLFNSPIMKAQLEMSAGEMGGYAFDSLKISYFTTERSLEEVIDYFAQKLGQEAEIEYGPFVDSPEEMMEMEEMTGLSWHDGFMEKYQRAYETYMDEESQTAVFNTGSFSDKMITIEIENPFLDPGTFKKVDKTSIMYMVMTLKKK